MILKKFFLLPLIFSLSSFVYADDLSDWDKAINLVNKEYGADYQKRSHMIEIESDNADRRHLEDLVKARYPADKVYFQSVRQK